MSAYQRDSSINPGQPLNDLPSRTFLATFLYRLLIVTAIYALFLPLIGPVLDHHFAERHPYHTHVYLAQDGGSHVHFYEQEHSHTHDYLAPDPSSGESPAQSSGIIYLTSNDGSGQSADSLVTTSLQVEVVYLALGDDAFLRGFGSQDAYPPESLVPPPEKPPRL